MGGGVDVGDWMRRGLDVVGEMGRGVDVGDGGDRIGMAEGKKMCAEIIIKVSVLTIAMNTIPISSPASLKKPKKKSRRKE